MNDRERKRLEDVRGELAYRQAGTAQRRSVPQARRLTLTQIQWAGVSENDDRALREAAHEYERAWMKRAPHTHHDAMIAARELRPLFERLHGNPFVRGVGRRGRAADLGQAVRTTASQ